jgi:predicted dehydrogenase
MQTTKVGIIGCGNISGIYFQAGKTFNILEIVACADQDLSRAQAKAEEHGVQALTVEQMLQAPEIEIIINLTIPGAHFPICRDALQAGKHVHTEKPLSLTREEGQELLQLAAKKNLRVGAAPDTFLGAGLQTCRELIDTGAIGEPLGATAFMLGRGPEGWHPDPEFFYKTGGGPMFDMGPYYLTALTALLGPIRRLTGSARISFPEREIGSGAKKGQKITVDIPTHIAGVLDFSSGVIGTLATSFDVWAANVPRIEIYGTEGSLDVPDPNNFGGPVRLWQREHREWRDVPVTRPYATNSRGIGVADMAYALQSGRPHRASGALGYHVLEAMHGFHDASRQDGHYQMGSTVERPAPLPHDLAPGTLDA